MNNKLNINKIVTGILKFVAYVVGIGLLPYLFVLYAMVAFFGSTTILTDMIITTIVIFISIERKDYGILYYIGFIYIPICILVYVTVPFPVKIMGKIDALPILILLVIYLKEILSKKIDLNYIMELYIGVSIFYRIAMTIVFVWGNENIVGDIFEGGANNFIYLNLVNILVVSLLVIFKGFYLYKKVSFKQNIIYGLYYLVFLLCNILTRHNNRYMNVRGILFVNIMIDVAMYLLFIKQHTDNSNINSEKWQNARFRCVLFSLNITSILMFNNMF